MAAAVPHGQHAQPADVLSCPPQQSPGSLQGLEDVFSEMARRSRSAAEASAAAKNEETQQSENTTATPRNTTETSHSASSALKADAEGNSTEVKPKSAMEEQIQRLADKLWAKYLELPQSKRLLIAVSGIPGSGTSIGCFFALWEVSAMSLRRKGILKPSVRTMVIKHDHDHSHNHNYYEFRTLTSSTMPQARRPSPPKSPQRSTSATRRRTKRQARTRTSRS